MTKTLSTLFFALLAVGFQAPTVNAQNGDELAGQARTEKTADLGAAVAGSVDSGWVNVEFDINKEGEVENAVVIESEPEGVFDSEAIKAIYRWKFKPKMVDGRPVRRRVSQRVEFALDPQSESNASGPQPDGE